MSSFDYAFGMIAVSEQEDGELMAHPSTLAECEGDIASRSVPKARDGALDRARAQGIVPIGTYLVRIEVMDMTFVSVPSESAGDNDAAPVG